MSQKKSIINKLKNNLKLGPPSQKVQQYRKTPVYTSIDKPIYVDWLVAKYVLKDHKSAIQINDQTDEKKENKENTSDVLSIDFKLGMTLCPGKHQDYAATGCQWKRDLTMDLTRLREEIDTDVIVTLLSEHDLTELKVGNLVQQIEKHNMKSYWYSIPDGTVPNDIDLWKKMVVNVANELTVNNKSVVVHCMGGLNRTGMFVLSVLKYLKIIEDNTVDAGVRWVRKSRKDAGGNGQQINFVKQLKFE